jgi:hypothetical protein
MNRITLSTSHIRRIGSALLCVGITAFLYWINVTASTATHSIGESQLSYAIQNAFASSHHLTLAEHFKNINDGTNTDRSSQDFITARGRRVFQAQLNTERMEQEPQFETIT